MQVAGHRGLAGVVAGIALLSVLAMFIYPFVSGPPIHLRTKRIAVTLMEQFALLAAAAMNIQMAISTTPAIVDFEQFAPAVPILELICVRKC